MNSLEKLFAGLVIYRHNLQCLHWNTIGIDFDPTHEKLDEYVQQVHGYIDEIAEMMKMVGQYPMCLGHCVEAVKSDETTEYLYLECNEDYESEDIWKNVNIMFNSMISLYEIAARDNELPGDIINKLQEHQFWFRKEGKYKGIARMKGD